jgi:type I restriction enzyme S subunit
MSEWKDTTLGNVIELKRGYDLPQSRRQAGSFPVVSSSGITDWHCEPMSKSPGVVTGRYGTLGEVYYITDDFWPLNTTLYVKDFKGNHPRFISYFLKSLDFSAYSDKAAVPGLNRNHLHTAQVKFPPTIYEQRSIAQILGSLDDKIELNRRMNETLEEMARAIFKDWFIDFGPTRAKMEGRDPYLPDPLWSLFPDAMDPESGLPEGWEVSSIGEEVRVTGGATPSTKEPNFWDGGIAWATPKDLSNLNTPVLLETARTITKDGLAKISSGLLPVGTVLLSSRAPVGYLAISEIPIAVNQGFIAIVCEGRLSNIFILLWAKENMDVIVQNANGSTFQEISKRNFRPIDIVLGSLQVLSAFDQKVCPFYQRIVSNEIESRILAELRDLLLPKLMSGEIRIQEAEKMVEEVM